MRPDKYETVSLLEFEVEQARGLRRIKAIIAGWSASMAVMAAALAFVCLT